MWCVIVLFGIVAHEKGSIQMGGGVRSRTHILILEFDIPLYEI